MKNLKYKDSEGNWQSLYDVYKDSPVINEPEYVDLGLPSGLLWATCNIGANSPEEAGLYFHWAGIEGITAEQATTDYKTWCTWENTPYSKGIGTNDSNAKLTKYCSVASYGNEGFTDELATLEPMDDAATQILGDGWRMPTIEEYTELLNNATNSWVDNYKETGINGRLFRGKGDYSNKELFFPACGNISSVGLQSMNSGSYVWSSSFNTLQPYCGQYLYFFKPFANLDKNLSRCLGFPIRGVKSKS